MRDAPMHSEVITHAGRRFRVELRADDGGAGPWDEEDGHIEGIRCLSRHEKPARGEAHLCDTDRDTWVYDFGRSIVKAAREKWGLSPDSREARILADAAARTGKKTTRAQVRAAAVRSDASHMAGFIRGDWTYCGVCVRILGADGEPVDTPGAMDSLWRVDYGHPNNPEYWREVAAEIAGEILAIRGQAWRHALQVSRGEWRERMEWEARGMLTE